MDIEQFDYKLPEDAIAYHPARQRDLSRLLVINRRSGNINHHKFSELSDFMNDGDGLVVNDTRVFKARFLMRRATGGKIEIFLLNELSHNGEDCWKVLAHPTRRLKTGEELRFDTKHYFTIVEKLPDGHTIIKFENKKLAQSAIKKFGHIPLPIYIHREAVKKDESRYQTIYSDPEKDKSVAAPTAGLHFTNRLLTRIKNKGVKIIPITLHVGYGTFKPVKVNDIDQHTVDAEYAEISTKAAAEINNIRKNGGKIFAVGSTSMRTLESVDIVDGEIQPFHGFVDLYIKPGFEFKVVDHSITNFHLPKSSLMILVSAFTGREKILEAYNLAVKEGYRFYSYGDSTLIL